MSRYLAVNAVYFAKMKKNTALTGYYTIANNNGAHT